MRNTNDIRILMLLGNNPYPKDIRVCQEATALVKEGYQVTVICPREAGQPFHEIIKGVKLYRFPAPPDATGALGNFFEIFYCTSALFLLSLYAFFRLGFDVVHTHNPPDTLVFIASFYKLLGKRYVFDHHDLSPEMYLVLFGKTGKPIIYKVLLWLERVSCRLADHVIATNASYKKIQMERHNVPEERITIVRNGPDLKRLRAPELAHAKSNQPGKTIICYAGVMGHQDGVDYLLRAIKHLVEDLKRLDFTCLLVGDGNASRELQILSKELGLTDYVSFTGWVSRIEAFGYMSTADICVAPEPSNSYNDHSTMIKIIEYMALGKAIVAFDLTEHRVTAQKAALYAQPNSELDFARKIFELMDAPLRREQMGNVGKDRVINKLAWPHQEKNLLKAYKIMCSLK